MAADKKNNTFFMVGGGTGGHLFPAIAIAQQLEKTVDADIHFIGTHKGIEKRVVPEHGYPIHFIAVRGVVRSLKVSNLLVPFRLVWSLVQSWVFLKKYNPQAVIGTGGYVCGPMVWMAAKLGFPTFVQEQNSYPGVTTRLLSPVVDKVFVAYDVVTEYLKYEDNIELLGNPVRLFTKNLTKNEAKAKLGFSDAPVIFVFGGSQGARGINNAVLEIMEKLVQETDFQIVWGTGSNGYASIVSALANYGDRVSVHEFIDDMELVYSAADLAVCRSGALTMAEVTQFGLPSILIPFQFAAANHQEKNARAFEKIGASKVILETDLEANILLETIKQLLSDTAILNKMSTASKSAAFPQATENIVNSILSEIGQDA